MNLNDRLERKITAVSDCGRMIVTRVRDSKGYGGIRIQIVDSRICGENGTVDITFDNERLGDEYEMKARELADLIEYVGSMCPCDLKFEDK